MSYSKGKYQKLKRIGKGFNSEVFLVKDKETNEKYAMK